MTENNKQCKAKSNMGLCIAMGAGVGIIFGQILFDNAGAGIVLGAGIGIAWGMGSNNKKTHQDD